MFQRTQREEDVLLKVTSNVAVIPEVRKKLC